MSVRILIRFNCLLRTGELLQLGVADIMINDQLTFATINLPDTRGKTHRHHRLNNTQMQHSSATWHKFHHQRPQAFRRGFRQLVDGLSLNNLLLKPYDQGDATSLCRAAYHWIMWCSKAAGQTNVLHRQDIATHSITSEAEGKMSQACDPLHREWPRSIVVPSWLFSFSNPVNWKHSQILNAWMCITYQEQKS